MINNKNAWRLFVVSCVLIALAVVLSVLVGAREYGARLDWFFGPVQAAGIQLDWVFLALGVPALVAYTAALVVDALSRRKA